jgi:hypothetical protein
MPPEMIKRLEGFDDFWTLECFASPFNYTAKNFCSAFAEDRELSYPEGDQCYGDFNSLISGLSTEKKVRFLYNPPYTNRIISSSLRLILNFIKKSPSSQLVAMIPNFKSEGLSELLSFTTTSYKILKGGEYQFYSHRESTEIMPRNLDVILVVKTDDLVMSTAILKTISEFFERS